MPKKPIKRSFKVWMRRDESGFASQFEIYSGKKEFVEKKPGRECGQAIDRMSPWKKSQDLYG